MKNNIKKMAFTLAEVLITLGIIGIVAEMTIPTLMNNVNTTTQRITFKKFYANLSQVFLNEDFQNSINYTSYDNFINSFSAYFKGLKIGVSTSDFGINTILCYDNPSASCEIGWGRAAFQTLDGVVVTYLDYANWSIPTICSSADGKMKNLCGEFTIDINGGYKKPNMLGYDIYYIYVYKNQDGKYMVAPIGAEGKYTCVSGSSDWTTSEGCGNAIILGTLK